MKVILYITFASLILFSCEEIFTPEESDDPRDKIVETWTCIEDESLLKTINDSYIVDISKSSKDSSYVIIDNFYQAGFGKDLKAKLQSKTLTITNEIIDGFKVNGTGKISNNYNKIDWTYTVEHEDGDVYSVTAVYTKGID